MTFDRFDFICLSALVAWVSLFLMLRCPSIFCLCSFACCSMLSISFLWGLQTVLRAAKLMMGIFRWSAVPNLATSDLLSTVSCCPGTFMVRVVSVVFTRAAPSGMASYMPCSCFLFLWAASVRRASWRGGLCRASGCWMLVDGSVKIRGISLLSLLASSSFCLLASCTSASLSRSSSYHLSSDINSSSPMMLSSKYLNVFDQLRLFLFGFVVMFDRVVFGFLP